MLYLGLAAALTPLALMDMAAADPVKEYYFSSQPIFETEPTTQCEFVDKDSCKATRESLANSRAASSIDSKCEKASNENGIGNG